MSRILIYSPNLGQTTRPSDSQQKIVNYAAPADHRIEPKEGEKRNKYLVFAEKKLLDMKVTVIPIVIGALGTVIKGLVKVLEELGIKIGVETI